MKKKFKIVIFGDLNNIICRILTWQLLRISKKSNIQIVKLINTGATKKNLILNIIDYLLINIFNIDKLSPFFNNKGIFLRLFSKLDIKYIKNISFIITNIISNLVRNYLMLTYCLLK